MKKALLVSFCLLFVLTSLVMARPATKGTSLADYNIQVYNDQNDVRLDGLFSAAQADTYWLAEYQFDSGGACVAQGWYGVDITGQAGILFHVDTYRAITGAQSMWCGHRASALEPWCGYAALPGYGNNWNQYLNSKAWAVTGDVSVAYNARYDSEGGYDFTYFEYVDTTTIAETWVTAETYDGAYDSVVVVNIPGAELPGTIKVRFHFASDGAWSDEDGLWNTQGAFILDDIVITDDTGGTPVVIETETWENEAVGATQSTDGDWVAVAGLGYGDYSGLFPGVAVLQEDICTQDLSCLWGFFNGSTDDYSCATPTPHPEQKVVPYENERGQFVNNEIWSPWIDLTGGGTVPPGASGASLEFYDYRNRPLDNLIFMVWHVRTKLTTTGCPGGWVDRNFVYYGPGPDFLHVFQPVGDILTPGDDYVQLAFGAVDMCPYWCGRYGTGDCHSHSPLIDRVKFFRINTAGAVLSVRDIDLFQDNFPTDGTTSGTVRIDAAIDRMPSTSNNIYPGDSLVFACSEPNYGLGLAADGRAAVYCYVKSSGGGTTANWEAPDAGAYTAKRYPYISGPVNGFYKFQCDSSYQDVAMTNPTPDKFCFDLNDAYFTPPARIDFYFSAVDGNATTIYWTQNGHTLVQSEAEKYAMEVQCLPTGTTDILYVDNFSGRGGQVYFDTAFELMGITPDRFDKRGPSSLVANGLGARAGIAQVVNVYHKILWNCGDLGGGNVGDGSGAPEKSADAQLLYTFLDQSSVWNPGLYISGDDVCQEMKTLNTPPFTDLFNFINYNVVNGSHVAAGYAIAPLVIGDKTGTVLNGYIFQHAGPPVIADTLVAFGGCPLINDFDVLQSSGTSVKAMYYNGGAQDAAVLTQQTVNAQGKTARVVLSGFSYHYIRDDRAQFPFDRLDHLLHIIRWFENTVDDPTGAGDTPIVNNLAQNYPNPFNPTTTIEFSIRDRAHVSLKVYNVAGQLVKTLEDNVLRAGVYTNYQWDGMDNHSQPVASGVYFYKLVTKNYSQTRKMVLLK